LSSFFEDLRYALRLFVRQPGFSLVAILILAIGIGANTAIFGVVNSVLLRPIPYQDADRVFYLWRYHIARNERGLAHSGPQFLELRSQLKSFSALAAIINYKAVLSGQGAPTRVATRMVSPAYFQVVGIPALRGRTFAPDEEDMGKGSVVILTESFWRNRFGADEKILGKTVHLDLEPFVVVGIYPTLKGDVYQPDMYLPKAITPDDIEARAARYLEVIGKLKPGVSVQQAESEYQAACRRMAVDHPDTDEGFGAYLGPAQAEAVGESRQPLFLLSAAVGLVLLVTCANLANLLMVRAFARSKEVAIRSAMGASQVRIFRQMITESVLLSLLGGIAGVLVAHWLLRFILAVAPISWPRLAEASLDANTLLFAVLVAVLAGVLFGFIPAWRTLRLNLADSLRDESRGSSGGLHRSRTRAFLVIAEVTLSTLLLFGAGLLLRTFLNLSQVNVGVRTDHVLTMRVTLAEMKAPTNIARANWLWNALRALSGVPGVQAVAATTATPMAQSNWLASYAIEGQDVPPPSQRERASYIAVSPGYFDTLGIRILRGRDFTERDTETAPLVVMVNSTFARVHFPGEDPVGKQLRLIVTKDEMRAQIVGVVADFKQMRPDEPPRQIIFQPHAQNAWPYISFVIRAAGDPMAVSSQVRSAFMQVDPDTPLDRMMPLSDIVEEVLSQHRLAMLLLAAFALVAVVLSSIGLYGVLSVAVAQRVRELGIRMALGANATHILNLVLKQGFTLTFAGLVAGLVIAPLAAFSIQPLLYGIDPFDLLTLLSVMVIMLATAFVACVVPAVRASRVDPTEALRAG
jgi:predicted permease